MLTAQEHYRLRGCEEAVFARHEREMDLAAARQDAFETAMEVADTLADLETALEETALFQRQAGFANVYALDGGDAHACLECGWLAEKSDTACSNCGWDDGASSD